MTISEHDLNDAVNMMRSEFGKELDEIKRGMPKGSNVTLIRSSDRAEIDAIVKRLDVIERQIDRLYGLVEQVSDVVAAAS